MKWENLKKNICPHCENFLIFDDDNEINCTGCRFHISPQRFKAILANRADPTNATYKLKWQYLRAGRCPRCQSNLRDSIGAYEVSECVNSKCTFKIRNDKMEEILQDPCHPCRQFEI